MTKVYSHLSAQERIRIDELRNRDGLGVCQIALRIGRDKSTVNREPGRGLWVASDENGSYRPYRPKRLKTGAWTSVFCQIFVGRFGVSFSPFERLFLGRFGFGQSCGLSVIA